MQPDILIFDDEQTAAREAAERFARSASRIIATRGLFHIAIPGGTSPRLFFGEISATRMEGYIPWGATDVFFTDERCVPPEDEQSNYRQAKELLFDRLPVVADNIHRFKGEIDPETAAKEYDGEMRRALGDDGRLDFVILGLGEDMHVASLFPNSPALDVAGKWATANYVEKPHTHRLTLTMEAINRAREIIILAFGESKADALKTVLQGEHDLHNHPAQAIQPDSGTLTWVVDKAAASRL